MGCIFDKLFCKHKWKTHASKVVTDEAYIETGSGAYAPTGIKKITHREILICENCGKIKTLEY